MVALGAASLAEIEKDPALLALARARGKTVFGDNCAPCHGSGGAGAKGYPNLNDDEWLWGGSARPDHADDPVRRPFRACRRPTRAPCWPSARRASSRRTRSSPSPITSGRCRACRPAPGYDAAAGAKIFADNCASCHGDNGKGNQELGAPDLTDKIWLYGSDEATLVETITNGRAGVMPAWVGRLDPSTIKALTVYVHSLGGGK